MSDPNRHDVIEVGVEQEECHRAAESFPDKIAISAGRYYQKAAIVKQVIIINSDW